MRTASISYQLYDWGRLIKVLLLQLTRYYLFHLIFNLLNSIYIENLTLTYNKSKLFHHLRCWAVANLADYTVGDFSPGFAAVF